MTSTRDRVFVSYSHEDRQHFAEFRRHLELLSRSTGIHVWTDEDLQAGDDFDAEIQRRLAETALAVFLVSPDALNSDYIGARELPALIRARENGEAIRLTCLHVAPTNSPNLRLPNPNGDGTALDLDLSRFQALNDPKAPVAQIANRADRDAVYADAARRIVSALESANRPNATHGPAGETTRRRSRSRAALIVRIALALVAAGTTYWGWNASGSETPAPTENPPPWTNLTEVLDAYLSADRPKQRSMAKNAKEWDDLLTLELGSMRTYEEYERLLAKVEATAAANPALWDASEDPITTGAPKLARFFNERSHVHPPPERPELGTQAGGATDHLVRKQVPRTAKAREIGRSQVVQAARECDVSGKARRVASAAFRHEGGRGTGSLAESALRPPRAHFHFLPLFLLYHFCQSRNRVWFWRVSFANVSFHLPPIEDSVFLAFCAWM